MRHRISAAATPAEACEAIEPLFTDLLANRDWLPEDFQRDAPESGMGGGIGQWLLFRSADRSLCLFSLVVPPGSATPVHDHLAWGLVGLYRGNQDEEFYNPRPGELELVRRRPLEPGDFYRLLPPRDDIHRVRTTSDVTSVSIHLLASDAGCILRHTSTSAARVSRRAAASPFRSGLRELNELPERDKRLTVVTLKLLLAPSFVVAARSSPAGSASGSAASSAACRRSRARSCSCSRSTRGRTSPRARRPAWSSAWSRWSRSSLRMSSVAPRLRWPWAVAAGWAAFFLAVLALRPIHVSPFAALVLACARMRG